MSGTVVRYTNRSSQIPWGQGGLGIIDIKIKVHAPTAQTPSDRDDPVLFLDTCFLSSEK